MFAAIIYDNTIPYIVLARGNRPFTTEQAAKKKALAVAAQRDIPSYCTYVAEVRGTA